MEIPKDRLKLLLCLLVNHKEVNKKEILHIKGTFIALISKHCMIFPDCMKQSITNSLIVLVIMDPGKCYLVIPRNATDVIVIDSISFRIYSKARDL